MEHFPELDLSSKGTNFVDLKRCFKMCVNDMTKRYLDEKEDVCSSIHIFRELPLISFIWDFLANCLNKYQQIQRFLGQKMNNELNKLILMDPKVKMAFMKEQKRFGQ